MMKKIINFLLFGLLILGFSPKVHATTLTFDDLPFYYGNTIQDISSGYGALVWKNMSMMKNPKTHYFIGGVNLGYKNGVVTDPSVAFSKSGSNQLVSIYNYAPFTFNSAYFTSAWKDNLIVDIKGYTSLNLNDLNFPSYKEAFSKTIVINTSGPVLYNLNFENIYALTLLPHGGTCNPATTSVCGENFVIDNFTINEPVPSPEPSSLLLGFLLIIGFLSIKTFNYVRCANL